jgi:hypothetical protein
MNALKRTTKRLSSVPTSNSIIASRTRRTNKKQEKETWFIRAIIDAMHKQSDIVINKKTNNLVGEAA